MSETMQAVAITHYGGRLEVIDRLVPRPGPGEVLVQVRASGLCSTDIHLLSGRQPLGELPRIVGHEIAGEVAELGSGVTGWEVGGHVSVYIDVTCGRCRHCLAGQPQRCRHLKRIGFERDGGHAAYVTVPADNLVALPPDMPFDQAAILPDAVACTYHCLIDQGKVGLNQRVVILGVGGLGIHGVQIARLAGAEVLATSRRPERLAMAERFGAVAVNTITTSIEDATAAFSNGEGVDVVMDNIGTRDSIRQGLSLLQPGGKLLVVAYLDESFEIPSVPFFKQELELIGCRGISKQSLMDVVRLVELGQLTPVIGARYGLADIAQAVDRLESGDLIGRIVLTRT